MSFVLLIQILLDLGERKHALGIAEFSKTRSLSLHQESGQRAAEECEGGCSDLGLDEDARGIHTKASRESMENEAMGAKEWRAVQEMARAEGCRVVEYFFLTRSGC